MNAEITFYIILTSPFE